MLSWSSKRQLTIAGVFIIILALAFGIPTYLHFANKPMTCSDGIQNQGEEGVDCGGPCSKVCSFDSKQPIVYYTRIFKISDGRYNVFALVENPNQGVFSTKAEYSFKLYGEDNVLLTEKDGTTVIPPGRVFPVFEYGLDTGTRIPQSVSFAISDNVDWQKGVYPEANLGVDNKGFTATDTAPVLEANIVNNEVHTVTNIKAIGLVYDKNENVIAASQTFINSIPSQGTKQIFFAWSSPFSDIPNKTQIFLLQNSF